MSVQVQEASVWKRVADLPSQYSLSAISESSYAIQDTDEYDLYLITTGSVDRTLTLPTASDNTGKVVKVIKSDDGSGKIVVDPEGSETINGDSTSLNLVSRYDFIQIVSDGSGWLILSQHRSYSTGWINRSDWTNVRMGSDDTLNNDSNVIHNLGVNIGDLDIEVWISETGGWSDAFRDFTNDHASTNHMGMRYKQVNANEIEIQTGSNGIGHIKAQGLGHIITTDDWHYNIVVKIRS